MGKFIEIPVLNEGNHIINIDAIQIVQNVPNTGVIIHFLKGSLKTIYCTLPYEEFLKLLTS